MVVKTALGSLWALTGSIIGLCLALPYGARDWKLRTVGGVWALTASTKRMIGSPAGQAWGQIVFLDREWLSGARPESLARILRHEVLGHVCQGMRWGPLFLLAYAFEFIGRYVWYFIKDRETHWYPAYYNLSWERKARAKEIV